MGAAVLVVLAVLGGNGVGYVLFVWVPMTLNSSDVQEEARI